MCSATAMPSFIPQLTSTAGQVASSAGDPTNQLVAWLALAPFHGSSTCSRDQHSNMHFPVPVSRLPLSNPLVEAKRHAQTTIDKLRQVFHLPKAQAAQQLGMGVSTLKRCCTALHIKRWPHRKLSCLKQVQEYHARHPLPDASAQQDVINMLQNERDAVMMNPAHELADEVVTKRVAMYKTTFTQKLQRSHDHALSARRWRQTKSEPGDASSSDVNLNGHGVSGHGRSTPHMHTFDADICDSNTFCPSRTMPTVSPNNKLLNNNPHTVSTADVSMLSRWNLTDFAVPDLTESEKMLSDEPYQAKPRCLQSHKQLHKKSVRRSMPGAETLHNVQRTLHPVHTHVKHNTKSAAVEEGSAQSTDDQLWLPVGSNNLITNAVQVQESEGSSVTPECMSDNKVSVPGQEFVLQPHHESSAPYNNMLSIKLPTTPVIKNEIFSPTLPLLPPSTALLHSMFASFPASPSNVPQDGLIHDMSNHPWMFATDPNTHVHTECLIEDLNTAELLITCPAALMIDRSGGFNVMDERKPPQNLECHCQALACSDEDLNSLLAVMDPCDIE